MHVHTPGHACRDEPINVQMKKWIDKYVYIYIEIYTRTYNAFKAMYMLCIRRRLNTHEFESPEKVLYLHCYLYRIVYLQSSRPAPESELSLEARFLEPVCSKPEVHVRETSWPGVVCKFRG